MTKILMKNIENSFKILYSLISRCNTITTKYKIIIISDKEKNDGKDYF